MNWLPARLRVAHLADRLPKLAEIAAQPDALHFYRDLVSVWKDPASVVLGASEPDTLMVQAQAQPRLPGLYERMMYLDMMTYLHGDILTKVDRASMAVSLEARVPLLDHRVVEFAWRLPTQYKYREGQGKWLLRQVLYRYLPRSLMERPKMGFAVPMEQWLADPLRDWAEDLLAERRLREEGCFNPAPVRAMWQEYLCGKRRWHAQLWNVLMFQAWLQNP
jgi:asparagine synthase (glutamine-hydrolysing)